MYSACYIKHIQKNRPIVTTRRVQGFAPLTNTTCVLQTLYNRSTHKHNLVGWCYPVNRLLYLVLYHFMSPVLLLVITPTTIGIALHGCTIDDIEPGVCFMEFPKECCKSAFTAVWNFRRRNFLPGSVGLSGFILGESQNIVGVWWLMPGVCVVSLYLDSQQ